MKNILIKALLPALLCAAAISASDNITSYASPVTANDFLRWGDTMWVATSGGLRLHNFAEGGAHGMIASSSVFPDLHLTTLCRDVRGDIWIGSRKGYLYRMTPRGQFTVYSNYKLSGWGITSLYAHEREDLIIVGTTGGVSLFDPVKGVALRNAARIANFTNPRVNAIEVFGDTLFLGCDEGVAYIDGLGAVPLSNRNFYDSGIWKTRRNGPVQSFVRIDGGLSAHPAPAAVFRDVEFVAADSGWLNNNGQRYPLSRITPWGTVQKLFNDGDRRLWIGSLDGFYYSWMAQGDVPEQHHIDAMTLRRATRVLAANDGNVWFLPEVDFPNAQWHQGVYRFDGMRWFLYNSHTHPGQFGFIGDGAVLGGVVGGDGTFWAGTSGGSVKHIDPIRNTAAQLIIGANDFRNLNYITNNDGDIVWGKSDALARDSSGYLWISVWRNNHGSLICYDPRYRPVSLLEHDPPRARYRRFFTEPPLKTENITVLNVDAGNRIFAYDYSQNMLTIFKHDGNPLSGGITVDTSFTDYGMVSAMVSVEDSTTYIAAVNGLRKVRAGSKVVEIVDSSLTNTSITSVAVRGSVLWLGTPTNGILRLDLAVDAADTERRRRWINEASGLPSNNIRSLALDRSGGRLWILTEEDGISQLDVGRAVATVSGKSMRAFPNVFSVSGSSQGARQITFEGLESGSSVSVYTLNGSLVARAGVQRFNENEWRAYWTPRRNLTPGTYIAIAKPSGKRTKIILKP